MTKIKLFVVLLVFGLAGIAFASNPTQDKHSKHEKAAACCSAGAACCDGGSCCADKEHESCATTKDGKATAKAENCCKPGAACCNGGSCCEKKAEANKSDSKPAKHANRDKQSQHADGCCSGGSCCTGGSCCAKHKSHG